MYTTKYTLSWNKKRLQNKLEISENKSEISDLFCWLFVSTYSEFVERCYKKRFFFQTASRTRRLEKYCLFCYTSRQIRCKLEQNNFRIKLEIYYRLFCSNLQCICREV